MGAFSAVFIGILAWVGYLAGSISMRTMLGMFVLAAIVFFIVAIGLNKYAVKEFKKISDKTEKTIIHEGDKLNLAALQWVDDNCDCPDDNGHNRENKQKAKDAYDKVMEHQKYDDDSIYYDDGTTKHRIKPSDFARETGYLPCDLQDNSKLDYAGFRKSREELRSVINNLKT